MNYKDYSGLLENLKKAVYLEEEKREKKRDIPIS